MGSFSYRYFDIEIKAVHELLCKAEQAVETCPCDTGCTKCGGLAFFPFNKIYITFAGIHSGSCREKNEVTSKLGALIVLKGLLGIEVDPDTIPIQTDELVGHDTIVEPPGVGAMAGVSVERDT